MNKINQTTFLWLYNSLKISILAFLIISCTNRKATEEAVDSTAAVVDSAAAMVDSAATAVVDSAEEMSVDSSRKPTLYASKSNSEELVNEAPIKYEAKAPEPIITYSKPIIDEKQQANFTDIKPIKGNTNFIVPKEMVVDSACMAYLGISSILKREEIEKVLITQYQYDNPEEIKNDNSFVSSEKTNQIDVYPQMKAVLRDFTDSSKNFSIKMISSEWQEMNTSNDSLYFWEWNITPKLAGKFKLQFALYGTNDATKTGKLIQVYNHNITVKAIKLPLAFPQKIKKFFSSFTEYFNLIFGAGGIGAVAILLWNNFIKKKK